LISRFEDAAEVARAELSKWLYHTTNAGLMACLGPLSASPEYHLTHPIGHAFSRANLRTIGRLCPIMSDRRNE
jgi:hypothetical protein